MSANSSLLLCYRFFAPGFGKFHGGRTDGQSEIVLVHISFERTGHRYPVVCLRGFACGEGEFQSRHGIVVAAARSVSIYKIVRDFFFLVVVGGTQSFQMHGFS